MLGEKPLLKRVKVPWPPRERRGEPPSSNNYRRRGRRYLAPKLGEQKIDDLLRELEEKLGSCSL